MNLLTPFLPKSSVVLIGLATIAFPVPALATSLVADYQFNNTLASSIGGAPTLYDLGTSNSFSTETVDGQSVNVFNFAERTGLQLSTVGLIPNDNYSVAALFNFDTVEGWRKIVDVNNRLTDSGLYNLNSNLAYYGKNGTIAEGTGAPIGVDEWVQVVFTRDTANQVVGYVDGVPQISFVDEDNSKILPDDVLHFFRDDLTTESPEGSENSGGAVARLRLYDGALTAAEVAALDRLPATPTAPPSEPEAVLVPPTEFPPDTNDPFTSATAIDISSGSGTGSGSVSTGSQIYKFNASAGQLLTLAVDVTGTSPGLIYQDDNSVLYIYNEAGEILGSNDNGVPGLVEGGESSILNFIVPEDGTYYAAVTTSGIGNDPTVELGNPFNTITGFAGRGLSNIDFDLNVSSASIPATARFFEIALAAEPSNPVGSFLIDGNTILNLTLNGQQNTSATGLINVIVGENTLTFDNIEFVLQFANSFPSTNINDILNLLDGLTATALIDDEFNEQVVFSEGQIRQSVPEPASVLGLLAFGALGASSVLKRKRSPKA